VKAVIARAEPADGRLLRRKALPKEFGFTEESVVAAAEEQLAKSRKTAGQQGD